MCWTLTPEPQPACPPCPPDRRVFTDAQLGPSGGAEGNPTAAHDHRWDHYVVGGNPVPVGNMPRRGGTLSQQTGYFPATATAHILVIGAQPLCPNTRLLLGEQGETLHAHSFHQNGISCVHLSCTHSADAYGEPPGSGHDERCWVPPGGIGLEESTLRRGKTIEVPRN